MVPVALVRASTKPLLVLLLFDMLGSFAPCGGIILSYLLKIVEIHEKVYLF